MLLLHVAPLALAAGGGARGRPRAPPHARGRGPPPACVAAGAYGSGGWGDQRRDAARERPPPASNRWQLIADCNVLLPDEGVPCVGLVHFVGGAVVGTAPLQSYGAFLEKIGAGGGTGLGIVATPVQGLNGLDHWAAATEVMLRWCALKRELDNALFIRGDPSTDTLPVIGCGHSLGAKLLVLLGSDEKMVAALGSPRVANVLISYNNYEARRSIPMFEQAASIATSVREGRIAEGIGEFAAFGAGNAISAVGELGATLGAGASSALRGISDSLARADLSSLRDRAMAERVANGGEVVEQFRQSLVDGLSETAQRMADFGLGSGSVRDRVDRYADGARGRAQASVDFDFSPSPIETNELLATRYSVRSNLVLRFADDSIDESSPLARLLQSRFTDAITGIGGRLDFKKLDGTHVTPNSPSVSQYVDGIDWALVKQLGITDATNAAIESVVRSERERDRAAVVVAEFIERQCARRKSK